ncbi:cation:proton antiporter [Oerskovia sp. M15]
MAVGLLLFEESLKLDMTRLRGGARRPVALLVTLGAVLTGIGATIICWTVLDLPLSRAAVIGAILIVSGPTVVGPLLAMIRPKQPLESVLAFEGSSSTRSARRSRSGWPTSHSTPRRGTWGDDPVRVLTGAVAAAVYVAAIRWGRVRRRPRSRSRSPRPWPRTRWPRRSTRRPGCSRPRPSASSSPTSGGPGSSPCTSSAATSACS